MSGKLERFGPLFLISGVGFFCISLFGMGLSAWWLIKDRPMDPVIAAAMDDPEQQELLASEQRGRKAFMSQGCLHCHSQFVRPIANEAMRYGPPSKDSEYKHEIPHLFGTRRVGPDLAREGFKRPDDWHYAHLYDPRLTVPMSNMPGFPWMFEEKDGAMIPNQEAKDLVAYMQSLGRAKRDKVKQANDQHYAGSEVQTVGLPADAEMRYILDKRGKQLFERHCVGCHGVNGDGRSGASAFLQPAAQNLAASQWNPGYVVQVLATGVPGSSMPAFRGMGYDDMRALSAYVSSRQFHDAEKSRKPTEAELAQGQGIYAGQCAVCHGQTGGGDGPAGLGLRPMPAKFTHQRPNLDAIRDVLKHGVPGTAMAPFAGLSDDEVTAVGLYLQSLYTYPLLEPGDEESAMKGSSHENNG